MIRLTGENRGKHGKKINKNEQILMFWCVPSILFWFHNDGMLYEMTMVQFYAGTASFSVN